MNYIMGNTSDYNIKDINDLISVSVIGLNIFALYSAINLDFDYLLGLIIVLYSQSYIKKLTTNSTFLHFKRPDDATNCSLFNAEGFVGNNSGFPSGHMGSTSFMTNLFYFKNCTNKNIGNYILYNFWNIFMGYARYNKNCHNLFQIICGYILGLCIAYLFYNKKKIYYYFKNI